MPETYEANRARPGVDASRHPALRADLPTVERSRQLLARFRPIASKAPEVCRSRADPRRSPVAIFGYVPRRIPFRVLATARRVICSESVRRDATSANSITHNVGDTPAVRRETRPECES